MDFTSVILSTAYLPPVQYFSKMLKYKTIHIEKFETYSRQTYRNRCEIYTANGKLPLVIPVVRPNGNRTKTTDVRIDYSVKWQREHWRALESAYKNSAYYEFIVDEFAPFYQQQNIELLHEFNERLLHTVLEILGLPIDIQPTDKFIKEYPADTADFRYTIHPKLQHASEDEEFNPKPYFQVFSDRGGFIPNLSIFDLLCNCGKESLEKIL
ncbi:MAG TPA: WbqC family protein [Tenuifilaceae bacterium]|nr:WbqC family protein [Tenuifilaceae bacterium]HPE18232.1 WbqC family protein [Tenuifilaceae bacterium]HPJ47010.1 WbqC family protein [Tenuifilaceae bacterium]HPQ35511.1 WbqC family protein [Tenuifilaceae bacterium]HRX69432.1 WbqC family protein [Tenuifilaceae bacterium]